jgi:excisionase family DNA binding protein
VDGAVPIGTDEPPAAAPTPPIPAEIAGSSARHRGFEPLTYGSGGRRALYGFVEQSPGSKVLVSRSCPDTRPAAYRGSPRRRRSLTGLGTLRPACPGGGAFRARAKTGTNPWYLAVPGRTTVNDDRRRTLKPDDRGHPEDAERLWTAADVASFLRVSRSWVYHRAESGDLPYLRIGALLRFEPEQIKAYARGLRVTAALLSPRRKK